MVRFRQVPDVHRALRADGKIISATTGIVPILKELRAGRLQVIGTGFYITRYGFLLTARHVIDQIIESSAPSLETLRVFHHEYASIHIRHVTRITYSHSADIALCECDNFMNQFPEQPLMNIIPIISFRKPQVGDKLSIFAYPRNALLDFTEKKRMPRMFARRFDGEFTATREPDRHGVKVYQTTIPLEGGASGAPVFNALGHIVGIARSSMDFGGGEHEGDLVSFVTPIKYSLNLGLDNLPIPEGSWDQLQIPFERIGGTFTIEDLIKFRHIRCRR